MKKHLNLLIITGLVTGFSLFVIITSCYIFISQPNRNGKLELHNLKDKVSIYFDNHGRPHVYANNLHDLVFTQGYLTAQDRLFQLDITRRAAKGELAEILGKKGLIRDKFSRDIGLIESAKNELNNSSKESLELLKYYSEGVTAYIEKHKHNLPLEFKVLNYRPKPWEPIDSILIFKQRAEELFEQDFPGNPIINYDAKKYLVFDEYILKKPNLLQRWKNIRQYVAFKKLIASPYFKIKKTIIEAADFLRNGSDRWEGFNWGSNCWVVGQNKNNNPILANDPHMEL